VIVSGIVDALKEFGIRDIQMPATPFAIWQAIQNAKAGSKGADVSYPSPEGGGWRA